jgi:Tfp pilus assembly protein PilE
MGYLTTIIMIVIMGYLTTINYDSYMNFDSFDVSK